MEKRSKIRCALLRILLNELHHFFFLHYHSNGQTSVCSQYPWITKKGLEGPGRFQCSYVCRHAVN